MARQEAYMAVATAFAVAFSPAAHSSLLDAVREADELDAVESIDILPYVPYGIDKAHRLGLKVYEAPQPPPEYGPAIVARLSCLTRKPVHMP